MLRMSGHVGTPCRALHNPTCPQMHTSLLPCAGLFASLTGRRAAHACPQVAAPDKSCELGDCNDSEDAGELAACGPLPALRRLTQVSPFETLTACAMFAGRSHAQSRDELRAGRRERRQQQQCGDEQQRAPDGRRRRCGPVAHDRVARAGDRCGRGRRRRVASRPVRVGSMAAPPCPAAGSSSSRAGANSVALGTVGGGTLGIRTCDES